MRRAAVAVDPLSGRFENGPVALRPRDARMPRVAIPVLIDTDMGVDDAVAIALALLSRELDVRALVSVGGNVDLDQATRNIGRQLAAMRPATLPMVGRGLDQQGSGLTDARHVFGADGLGECGLPDSDSVEVRDLDDVYGEFLAAGDELTIVAIGPLTNVAHALARFPDAMRRVRRLVIMGGALWCKGNVGAAEFNIHRDPAAAAAVFASGLPISVVPLDATRFVTFDESHLAHLAASETRAGEFLARVMAYPMRHSTEAGPGRFVIHDALAVGACIWPELFVRTRLAIDVVTAGAEAGRTRPRLAPGGGGVDAISGVNATDFLENLLERLCQQREFGV